MICCWQVSLQPGVRSFYTKSVVLASTSLAIKAGTSLVGYGGARLRPPQRSEFVIITPEFIVAERASSSALFKEISGVEWTTTVLSYKESSSH